MEGVSGVKKLRRLGLEGVSGVKKLRRLGVWKEHLGIKGEWNLHENDIQKKQ